MQPVKTTLFDKITQTLELYKISPEEQKVLKAYAKTAEKNIEPFIQEFYTWMPNVPEFEKLFSQSGMLEHVQKQQNIYWKQFFTDKINEAYVKTRAVVGDIHATIDLPISSYCAAMSFALNWWQQKIKESGLSAQKQTLLSQAINTRMMLDTAIVTSTYHKKMNEIISKQMNEIISQQQIILEFSTPIIKLWEGILIVPLIGSLDGQRAQQIIENLLESIVKTESRVVIIDVTGVSVMDTQVTQHLVKTTQAAGMLGTQVIMTGINPAIAQTLVRLGVDLSGVNICNTLQTGFKQALSSLGQMLMKNEQE